MKYLLHMDDEDVSDRIDLATYVLVPGKPFKFERDDHAELFLAHKHYHGVVTVPQTESETGIKLDVEGARKLASEALAAADAKVIADYVYTQQQDRLRINFPPVPPQGRAAKVLERNKTDLAAIGIKPFGYANPADGKEFVPESSAPHSGPSEREVLLLKQLEEQRQVNADNQARLDRMEKAMNANPPGMPDQPTPPPPATPTNTEGVVRRAPKPKSDSGE